MKETKKCFQAFDLRNARTYNISAGCAEESAHENVRRAADSLFTEQEKCI